MKDKSTLTHLFGLNKTIEKKSNDDKPPTLAKATQMEITYATTQI